MRAAFLVFVVLIFIALVVWGCASSAPLRVGSSYLVQWPGAPVDVVTVERTYRHSVVACRSVLSVQREKTWLCNFRMALYYREVTTAVWPVPPTELLLRVAR